MNKKTLKRQRDLKTKLMAAISMLLVSSLMMVTSTYAWFTLSTAPEVTGISTAVGANGNLEMALLPESGLVTDIKSSVGDSMSVTGDVTKSNITWGNLVDLEEKYGLEKITLYPSQLNAAVVEDGNPTSLAEALLSTPTYGADGRVSEVIANTITSTFDTDTSNFPNNDKYGVRAVGTASGMTDRQLAYRNARSAAGTAMAQAKNAAANSLTTNGNALANIAIKHGTNKTATHTQEEVNSLLAIVNDLLGTDATTGILEYIEQSYIQYIVAYGASQKSVDAGMDDIEFNAFKNVVESATSLEAAIDELEKYGITVFSDESSPIVKLSTTMTNVTTAQSKLNALKESGSNEIAWTDLYNALTLLANPDEMAINDIPAKDIMSRVDELVKTIGAGLTVSMTTGGGVYADVADHCGDYNASIVIEEINYGSLSVTDMAARMATKSTVTPSYLSGFGTTVQEAKAPSSADDVTMPLTEMYGYIIDLAFRTNAAESDLLLQQEGIDRIYDENSNEDTMGHGSSMTFASTTTDFTDVMVKELMKAIRIVFFQKDGRNVLATAKLDAEKATTGADGVTALMYLYEVTAGGEEVYEKSTYDATATGVEYFTKSTGYDYTAATDVTADNYAEKKDTLYTQSGEEYVAAGDTFAGETTYYTRTEKDVYTKITSAPAENTDVYIKKKTTAGENILTDNVITSLTQNEATQVSVLVYLDGNNITNAQVASTAATSVTGTMNLQFASSATLVPMEYADLHIPAADSSEPTTETTTETTP